MLDDYDKAVRVADQARLEATLGAVREGDTVTATFYDKTYRAFEVTGVVRVGNHESKTLMVASWQLNVPAADAPDSDDGQNLAHGKPFTHLKELVIVRAVDGGQGTLF